MRWAFDDFVLDSEGYGLRLEGESIAVEPRVLELLTYLIEQRDRVLSKDEFLLDGRRGVASQRECPTIIPPTVWERLS